MVIMKKNCCFKFPLVFAVPLQCPNSAPTMPRDSALHDSLCKFCTREPFRSNGGNRKERYSFYLNSSFVTHVCLLLRGNLYAALSRHCWGIVGALSGHCTGHRALIMNIAPKLCFVETVMSIVTQHTTIKDNAPQHDKRQHNTTQQNLQAERQTD